MHSQLISITFLKSIQIGILGLHGSKKGRGMRKTFLRNIVKTFWLCAARWIWLLADHHAKGSA
ncbi:hypothetical protein AVM02_10600 [Brucella anthropi]